MFADDAVGKLLRRLARTEPGAGYPVAHRFAIVADDDFGRVAGVPQLLVQPVGVFLRLAGKQVHRVHVARGFAAVHRKDDLGGTLRCGNRLRAFGGLRAFGRCADTVRIGKTRLRRAVAARRRRRGRIVSDLDRHAGQRLAQFEMPGIVEAVLASGLAEDDHAGLDQVGDLHGSPGEDDTGQALVEIAADLSLLVNDHADGATEAQVKLPYRLGPWPKLHADLAAVQGYRGGIRFAAGPGPREGIDFNFRAAAEL